MKNVVLIILFLMCTGLIAADYDTLVLQQGKDGYKGCLDVSNMNDYSTDYFSNQIPKSNPRLPIANYRC